MYQVEWNCLAPVIFTRERGVLLQNCFVREHQKVLRVPPFDLGILPNPRPQAIDRNVLMHEEVFDPIVRPLLVYVLRSTLEGYGGGKENDGAEFHEGLDVGAREFRGKVLGYFERKNQIKLAPQANRLFEVMSHKRF